MRQINIFRRDCILSVKSYFSFAPHRASDVCLIKAGFTIPAVTFYRSCGKEGVNLNRQNNPGHTGEGEAITRVRTPNKKEREVLGTVISMLGASRVVVRCIDGVTRMCRIRGKMKKRVWVREGDVVIVVPWEIQDEKGDVTWRYTGPQVSWLERKGYLKSE